MPKVKQHGFWPQLIDLRGDLRRSKFLIRNILANPLDRSRGNGITTDRAGYILASVQAGIVVPDAFNSLCTAGRTDPAKDATNKPRIWFKWAALEVVSKGLRPDARGCSLGKL